MKSTSKFQWWYVLIIIAVAILLLRARGQTQALFYPDEYVTLTSEFYVGEPMTMSASQYVHDVTCENVAGAFEIIGTKDGGETGGTDGYVALDSLTSQGTGIFVGDATPPPTKVNYEIKITVDNWEHSTSSYTPALNDLNVTMYVFCDDATDVFHDNNNCSGAIPDSPLDLYCKSYDGGGILSETGSMSFVTQPCRTTTHSQYACRPSGSWGPRGIYWYDSCGRSEEIKEECSSGCNYDEVHSGKWIFEEGDQLYFPSMEVYGWDGSWGEISNTQCKEVVVTPPAGGGGGGGTTPKQKEEQTCEPEWDCTAWSDCKLIISTRTCEDVNGCTGAFDKPSTRRLCNPFEPVEQGDKDAEKQFDLKSYWWLLLIAAAIGYYIYKGRKRSRK